MPTLRRGSARKLKVPISYKWMIGKEYVKYQDIAFLATIDPMVIYLLSLLHPVCILNIRMYQTMIHLNTFIIVLS